MANWTGYTLEGYGMMITEKVRMEAYIAALKWAVHPGSVVVDIGSGTGIFALLACQLGARQVYAIEPDDAIQVARQIAQDNGYSDRIQFFQDISTRVVLPETADVIVSDLRGILPFLQYHIPSIIDARQRFLSPRGVLIPQKDTLWAALVESSEQYKRYIEPWQKNPYDLNMSAGHEILINHHVKALAYPEKYLAEPIDWFCLDYYSIQKSNASAEISWEVSQSGIAHGLTIWFDATLIDGITFSNAPGKPELIYGRAFFPFSEPVKVTQGDLIKVNFSAQLVANDYIYRWQSRFYQGDDETILKASYDQSTFYGFPQSLSRLHRQEANYVAQLNPEGEIDRFILNNIDAQTTILELANKLLIAFPNYFHSLQGALTRVGELSGKYSL